MLRHGESAWNKENRFTGWTDVRLSETGVKEAKDAGKVLKEKGYTFDLAYTSVLSRAIQTFNYAAEELDLLWIPLIKDWRLNERHYGGLQGLNKSETAKLHGEDKVKVWRRSYDIPPPVLDINDKRHPIHDKRYANVPKNLLPATEVPSGLIAESEAHDRPSDASVEWRDHQYYKVREAAPDRRSRQLHPKYREVPG